MKTRMLGLTEDLFYCVSNDFHFTVYWDAEHSSWVVFRSGKNSDDLVFLSVTTADFMFFKRLGVVQAELQRRGVEKFTVIFGKFDFE